MLYTNNLEINLASLLLLNGYDIDAKATGTVVGGWSAGCQVPCEIQKYKKQMQEFKASKQSTFTYCLLKEF